MRDCQYGVWHPLEIKMKKIIFSFNLIEWKVSPLLAGPHLHAFLRLIIFSISLTLTLIDG